NSDLDLATRKGIPVFHTPGRNADAVADLTLAFLLMLARHLGPLRDTFRQGGGAPITGAGDFVAMYNRFTGVELGGRTVGLVALGAVGREVAARLVAFKARVLAYDPYVTDPPPGVELRALDDLLGRSDFVSLHAPVTPEPPLPARLRPRPRGVLGCARALGACGGGAAPRRRAHPGRGRHQPARGLRVRRSRGRGPLRRAEPGRARGRRGYGAARAHPGG